MKIEQKRWSKDNQWESINAIENPYKVQLVFAFGERRVLENSQHFNEIRKMYPNADILTASSSGNILGTEVLDGQIVVTAIYFEATQVKAVSFELDKCRNCFECGEKIALKLQDPELAHVFVISDGQDLDGSSLVKGIATFLPETCKITGGLAGDGERFEKTLVGLNQSPKIGQIAAIGFYGSKLKVGFRSVGGWVPFGPLRKVTRSIGNVLYELDGQPALELYKKYLGEKAAQLPGSALLFPLSLHFPTFPEPLVRTVLKVNEEEGSMTFAGSIPEGCSAQLMKANFEGLIEGAGKAATSGQQTLGNAEAQLAILISCVGRRMVLGQRTVEELESVQEVLGKNTVLAGFYSYGEMALLRNSLECSFSNA